MGQHQNSSVCTAIRPQTSSASFSATRIYTYQGPQARHLKVKNHDVITNKRQIPVQDKKSTGENTSTVNASISFETLVGNDSTQSYKPSVHVLRTRHQQWGHLDVPFLSSVSKDFQLGAQIIKNDQEVQNKNNEEDISFTITHAVQDGGPWQVICDFIDTQFDELEGLLSNILYSITDEEIRKLKGLGMDDFNKLVNDAIRKKRMHDLMGDFGKFIGNEQRKRTPEELEYLDRLAEFDRFVRGNGRAASPKSQGSQNEGEQGFEDPMQYGFKYFKKIQMIAFGPQQMIAYC